MGKVFEYTYQVPFYQVDVHKRMRLSRLLSLALQVSGLQSESLGISDQLIFDQYGLIWVVTAYEMTIDRLPTYGEEIVIRTQATSYSKFTCYRDFELLTKAGESLLQIQATFVLVDFQTRRPHQVVEDLLAPYQAAFVKKRQLSYAFPDLVEPVRRPLTVVYADLDANGHVNNGSYLDWFYNDLPLPFLADHQPSKIHLTYLKEIQADCQLEHAFSCRADTSQHQLTSASGLHAQAVIEWRKDDL